MNLPRPSLALLTHALAAIVVTLASAAAWAHGGEDHGEAAPAVASPAAPQAPRATARTDSFELVAVLQAGDSPTLTLYLDRADTNAPVAGASIEVESGAFKGTAKAIEPGVYTLPAQALAKPGHYPLAITVQSADTADLMDATLNVEAPSDHAADHPTSSTRRWPRWAAAAALLFTITAAWRLRRRAAARKEPA
ncbi:MAG TPA: hypothetical protein VFW84_13975 [Aquabacterium sp.]|uniref:hypothetical protein n=1 Tax=Aquabacterium sp. TaxID=1872578 RepID=UPI002E35ECB0|nr:hypothetical protein [Aquabacterium sp.]HEX5373829.1 hypothetical protein [Aquabacterium sp.]